MPRKYDKFKILYRDGGTCWDYRPRHLIIHRLFIADYTVGITVSLYTEYRSPDVLARGGPLMSSRLEGWLLTGWLPSSPAGSLTDSLFAGWLADWLVAGWLDDSLSRSLARLYSPKFLS
jgi:hypothetical protein